MCNINKALIVTPFFKPNIGGAETFAEDLAKALAKKYNVHICTVKLDKPITFEGMDYRKAFYLIRRLSLPLLSMVRRYKYERVFALGLMSILLCSLFRIKFDAVIFNLFKKKSWRNYLLNRAGKIYVEGNTGKNNLLSIGIPESKIAVFHHWCDQSVFTWKERTNKNLRVLFISRPIAIKGKHIVQECEHLTNGVEYEYVENCEFKELPKHYQMADVVVIPSIYNDSFSRICVEAASCGCAVIVSNRGSLPEQVEGFGKVIEPNAISLAYILNKLALHKEGLEKLRLETLVYAKQHFTDKNADCFLL